MTADPLEEFESEEQGPAPARPEPPQPPALEAARPSPSEPLSGSVEAVSSSAVEEMAAEARPAAEPAAPGETGLEPIDTEVGQALAELASTIQPEPIAQAVVLVKPRGRFWRRGSPRVAVATVSWRRRLLGFGAAFVVGALLAFFLVSAAALLFSGSYANRVLPGVHAGSVDLSGLTRDQAIARLESRFSYLGQGEVTLTTPLGTATITYQQAGRAPDVEAMADAAMAIGHTGGAIADAATLAHAAVFGEGIPVVIRLDPTGLATRIRQLVGTSTIEPRDAQAMVYGSTFAIVPAANGFGIDEKAIEATIIDRLTDANAPADLRVGGTFVTLTPQVSQAEAKAAVAQAGKMIAGVNLTWSVEPASAPASWKPATWTISAAQIRDWLIFGTRPDGTYAPELNAAPLEAYLQSVTSQDRIAPVEPNVTWDSSGKPVALVGGKDGLGVDVAATAAAVSAYLDSVAAGGSVEPSLEIVTGPVSPQIASIESVAGMVDIGSHTTVFYPDISNGYGKNIRQPAINLNGQVVGPGQHFSFLTAVGPIDPAHGFTLGGVILDGKSDHTGAIGGGICSASTTMFNAAANAGLQIDERHAHFYYINRYPVGRDATVYSNGVTTYDLRWTNDTPYPIVIRAWATYGSTSRITVQLWSWPTGRTVTWTGGKMADVIPAVNNPPEYVTSLAPGVKAQAEYADPGFKTSVTRIVTDASGKIIHDDTWFSSYAMVRGQELIGRSTSSTPKPTPAPSVPSPTPGVIPAPSATANSRRRRVA